jgi:hypothetical protein
MKSGIKICAVLAILVVLVGVILTSCMFFSEKGFDTIFPTESNEEIDGSDEEHSKLY